MMKNATPRARRLVRRFCAGFRGSNGERGSIIVIAAVSMTIFVFAAALAIDIGGRVQETRREQAVADLAALDAARDLTTDAATQSLAVASALRNGVDISKPGFSVVAVRGTLTNGVFTANAPNPNAVQVTVTTPYNDFFGRSSTHLSRSSVGQGTLPPCGSNCGPGTCVGTCTPPSPCSGSCPSPTPSSTLPPGCPSPCGATTGKAQFWIGSTLADVNLGLGRFNNANLTAVGYNGLLAGNVTLGALRTALGFNALTPDQVLASSVKVSDLVNAAASLLNANNPTAAAALTLLGTVITGNFNSTNTILVGDALGLKTGQGAAASTNVNLLEMIAGGIDVANQKAALAVNLNLNLLNLASASVTFAGITPPTYSIYGPVGITATNTQVTANLNVTLNGLSVPGINISTVVVPMSVTLGGATGTLAEIDCSGSNPFDIQLNTTFSNVNLTIQNAVINGLTLLGLPIVLGSVSGSVNIPSTPVNGTVVYDPANFVPNQAPVTASSNLGGATATTATNLTVLGLLNLALTTSQTNVAIDTALNSIMPTLINTIFNTLKTSYGIHIGNASYLGVLASCGSVKLGG